MIGVSPKLLPPPLLQLPPLRLRTPGVAAEVPEKRRNDRFRDFSENNTLTSAKRVPKGISFLNDVNNLGLIVEEFNIK